MFGIKTCKAPNSDFFVLDGAKQLSTTKEMIDDTIKAKKADAMRDTLQGNDTYWNKHPDVIKGKTM